MAKNDYIKSDFKDLAKLILITREIESLLDGIDANGKGMYEKAKSVSRDFISKELLKRIYKIAEIRNRAVHHSPEIDNIQDVLVEAKLIRDEVKKVNKELNYYYYFGSYKNKFMIFIAVAIFLIVCYSIFGSLLSYELSLGQQVLLVVINYYVLKTVFRLSVHRDNIFYAYGVYIIYMTLAIVLYENRIFKHHQITCNEYSVIATSLNVREKSNKFSKILGVVYQDDVICINKDENNWGRIENKGWVSKKYLISVEE